MGFADQMNSSLKRNNRRKAVHTPFSKNKKSYEKSEPIKSKKFNQFEKDLLEKKLNTKRDIENEQNRYKLVISFGVTVLVISGIVFTIKIIFF
jgi:hypothetical protein